ncbi:uncharacterized protein EI97DRAFT_460914 [Westerdykella ornata]|uniref:Uncharacterized protein n=1 Tax=Westerdykella ornata TaxID=318751 RepID=A0A6A6JCJ7_WESOR|nr:uncharacterized protein EI97DRAFT_460914 [Westerdykella ornata]KAF2273728.1 hypothetical protein EI97DRAFT_460914 [Westerdykella ornata]
MTTSPTPMRQKRQILRLIHHVLRLFETLCKEVTKFNNYVNAQSAQGKPLYKWAKYTRFERMSAAVEALSRSAETLNRIVALSKEVCNTLPTIGPGLLANGIIPPFYSEWYLQALTAKALQDVQGSELDEATKQEAEALILKEHSTINNHLSAAKASLQAVTELLFKILSGSPAPKYHLLKLPQGIGQDENEATGCRLERSGTADSTSARCVTVIEGPRGFGNMLGLLIVGIGLCFVAYRIRHKLPKTGREDCAPLESLQRDIQNSIHMISDLSAQVGDVTAYTANLESKIDAAAKHSSSLEQLCEDLGLRIDSIWDSLGPPNEDGTYRSVNENQLISHHARKDLRSHIDEVSEEVVKVRREMHRMNIRLTKDMDDLKKNK